MENEQEQAHQPEGEAESGEAASPGPERYKVEGGAEVIPGVSVVRGNTPRPHPFEAFQATGEQVLQGRAATSITFPGKAPSAPPLPEELEDDEQEQGIGTTEVSVLSESATVSQEFVWLFEYGLEMDSTFLNSSERLNGAGFLYGPAVLRGYALMFAQEAQTGHFLGTIVPSAPSTQVTQPGEEVWGILYRVPRHVTVGNDKQVSLLDTIHAAGTPSSLFASVPVTVRETYHEREIACGTYVLTAAARRQLHLLTPEQADAVTPLVRRIASLARRQKLPAHYLTIPLQKVPSEMQTNAGDGARLLPREQNTDPLPAIKGKSGAPETVKGQRPGSPPFSRMLAVLAIYLILLLLLILAFAVLHGMGFMSRFLTTNLQLLGVPWLVLVYGVLGGNVSSIIALGHARRLNLPLFALMLWFVRPFVGGALALFAYLLVNSGLFTLASLAASHTTLFPLLGVLAGLCEGRLFGRWR